MTKTTTIKCFVQEKVESGEISIEQIKEITAVIQQPNPVSSNVQQTEQVHQAIRAVFDGLRQSACETHAPRRQSHRGAAQAREKGNPTRALAVPVATSEERALFQFLQAFFDSDRSSSELLKLSHRLAKLAKAYTRNDK